jgi:Bacterial type II/III secretion system short domain
MNLRHARTQCLLVLSSVTLAVLSPAPACGQGTASGAGDSSSVKALVPVVKLYPLKSVLASDAAKLVKTLINAGDFQLAVDERTNSLIVRAAPHFHKTVEKLLVVLDKGGRNVTPRNEVKIFALQHRHEVSSLQRMLQVAVDGSSTTFAIDPMRNTVIAKGDTEGLKTLEAVLLHLDSDDAQRAGEQVHVRIVWLVSGLDKKNAAPPADLKDVVDELAKIGVKDLQLAAQSVVSTMASAAGTQFTTQGRATLKTPTQLEVTGTIARGKGNQFTMEMAIEARDSSASAPVFGNNAQGRGRFRSSSKNLCSINTTVSAPPGHAVVLGVTPIDSMNSVFVIQVLPKKSKKK